MSFTITPFSLSHVKSFVNVRSVPVYPSIYHRVEGTLSIESFFSSNLPNLVYFSLTLNRSTSIDILEVYLNSQIPSSTLQSRSQYYKKSHRLFVISLSKKN